MRTEYDSKQKKLYVHTELEDWIPSIEPKESAYAKRKEPLLNNNGTLKTQGRG